MVLTQKTSIQMYRDHTSLWWKQQMLNLSCWLYRNMTSTTGLLDYTTIRGLFCFTSRVIMNITASERHCSLVGTQLLSVIRWFICDYATTMFASDFKANIHHRRSSEMSRDIYSVGVISPWEPGKCRTWAALNPLCAGEDRITLALHWPAVNQPMGSLCRQQWQEGAESGPLCKDIWENQSLCLKISTCFTLLLIYERLWLFWMNGIGLVFEC